MTIRQVNLLTSKAIGEDEQKALDAGFLDFMPKPVLSIRVVPLVKRALELIIYMQSKLCAVNSDFTVV